MLERDSEAIQRKVAIKILKAEYASNAQMVSRFEREAQASTHIESPHVVQVFDAGVLADGRLLIALTRFEGLGGRLQLLPLGLTTPEMAALMGALGCRDAVLLDGGVSGQLAIRDAAGEVRRWPGLRRWAWRAVSRRCSPSTSGRCRRAIVRRRSARSPPASH